MRRASSSGAIASVSPAVSGSLRWSSAASSAEALVGPLPALTCNSSARWSRSVRSRAPLRRASTRWRRPWRRSEASSAGRPPSVSVVDQWRSRSCSAPSGLVVEGGHGGGIALDEPAEHRGARGAGGRRSFDGPQQRAPLRGGGAVGDAVRRAARRRHAGAGQRVGVQRRVGVGAHEHRHVGRAQRPRLVVLDDLAVVEQRDDLGDEVGDDQCPGGGDGGDLVGEMADLEGRRIPHQARASGPSSWARTGWKRTASSPKS